MKLKPEWVEAWKKNPMLHVHAQQSYHTEAYLVMNEAGRQQLLALLQQEGPVATGECMPADGEGFDLCVVTLSTEHMLHSAQEYTDVNTLPDDRQWPWDIPEVRAAMVQKAELQAAEHAAQLDARDVSEDVPD